VISAQRKTWLAFLTWCLARLDERAASDYDVFELGDFVLQHGMTLRDEKFAYGNWLSWSPSNMPPPYDRVRFPNVTYFDNVRAQHRLVTENFGIEELVLVVGWSMAAGQTYQWAVS
jgi:homoserine O-acetyltransferase